MAATHDLILFDLDGTLSDPMEGFGNSFNYALHEFGYPPLERDALARFVGPPIDHAFREVTGKSGEAEVLAMVAKYRERYAETGYAENVVYPGVPEALQALGDAGVPMAVCTSKRRDFAVRILTMFGLIHHFRFVDGGDVGMHKGQQIAALLSQGKASRSSIMVGDRAADMLAAHRNGLPAAGVLWGYGSEAELANESPRHLFASPGELPGLAMPSR